MSNEARVKKCAVCGKAVSGYDPLPDYYYEQSRLHGYPIDEVEPETLNRNEYHCPECGCTDRDRLYALYIDKRFAETRSNGNFLFLDIAPSYSLSKHIKENHSIKYRTLDISMEGVDYRADLTDISPVSDGKINAFMCSHVLEHVSDDRKAISELYRILKPGGWGIVMVPINLKREKTDEDFNASHEERWRHFGQGDHVRAYARLDFIDRLSAGGFTVRQYGVNFFGADTFFENGLNEKAVLYVVEKPEGSGETQIFIKDLTKIYPLYKGKRDRMKEALSLSRKKLHEDFYALDAVSFEVKKGECVGIVGKNGAGKSTLLKILTGVLTPTSGEVNITGRVSALLELGAGFNPEYTGMENIYLNGAIMGYTKDEMRKKSDEIIEFADIGSFINQPVKLYSSGMYVRLAFAVAINVEPDILIVDEALSVGDAAFQAKCISKMQKIMETGTTVLFVTHDTNTVKRFCRRCVYLENGKVKQEGPAEEIADLYLREIREDMNKEHVKLAKEAGTDRKTAESKFVEPVKAAANKGENYLPNKSLINSFDKKVKNDREGTGAMRVHFVELLNENNESIAAASYNQTVKLRLYIRFYEDCEAHVAYHIRNSKNMELIGSSTLRENLGTVSGKKGEWAVVEFITPLPLMEGAYNVTTVVSQVVIPNRSALFIDYIENTLVFEVLEAELKLWDQVYIKNKAAITKIGNHEGAQ